MEILVFEVGDRRFGISSRSVVEVVRAVTLAPLPAESPVAEGLLNLRGRVVPVLDVRSLFNLPRRQIEHSDHLIVIEDGDRMAALRVDRATDLIGLRPDAIQTLPANSETSGLTDGVAKTDDGIVHLLVPCRLLALDETAMLADAGGGAVHREPRP
jgi:purine-binding chemotaxis protein CheW